MGSSPALADGKQPGLGRWQAARPWPMASPALADGKLLALTHPECLGTDAHNYRRWPAEALTYAAHAPVAQTARNKSWASAANRRAFRKLPTCPIFPIPDFPMRAGGRLVWFCCQWLRFGVLRVSGRCVAIRSNARWQPSPVVLEYLRSTVGPLGVLGVPFSAAEVSGWSQALARRVHSA